MNNNLSKEELINQAIKFHLEGNIPEATKYYKYCISKDLNDPIVFSNYGSILKDLGKLQEAKKCFFKAISLNPDFADAHSNLGNLLRDLGDLKEAEVSTRKAISLNPAFANGYLNLGLILRDLGDLKEAEVSTRKAISLNPNFANAHLTLGLILRDLGKLQEAEVSTRNAIQLNPNFANAHLTLGLILRDLGKLQEAEISIRNSIQINPEFANSHYNLGTILRDLGKLQEAESSYRKAIKLNPNFTDAYFNLFRHYEEINNLEKLKESLNQFQKIDNIKNELILFKARLSFRSKEYKTAKEFIDNISLEWIESINCIQNTIFWNYKAFIEDKIGNYDTAYFCFKKSQETDFYARFDKHSFLEHINSYKNSIINKKRRFNNFNDGIEDSNIVFLIGFPRSGTTLLDTILRSHKDIEVIEEKPLISILETTVKEKFITKLDNLFNISEDNIIILRKKYFELLMKYKTKNSNLTIDKLPLNTVALPLINLIFPNAKIIFSHRHPYDTVLSCFQQSFNPNSAMINLVSLKSSSIMYDQVMNAWNIYKNNLSLNFITSKYENLIEEFDNHTFQVLEFLDVGWDENVKNYRQTALERGKINTPSSSQVVQPLYKSSIDKWKNYEKYFEDCHQYLKKWISYFDY